MDSLLVQSGIKSGGMELMGGFLINKEEENGDTKGTGGKKKKV